MLTRLQDEVHRYTVAFQTKKHAAKAFESSLTEIPGIGPKKAQALLAAFRTKQALKDATPSEIAKAMHISEEKANEVIERFISGIK